MIGVGKRTVLLFLFQHNVIREKTISLVCGLNRAIINHKVDEVN